jgi:hypothetical protein
MFSQGFKDQSRRTLGESEGRDKRHNRFASIGNEEIKEQLVDNDGSSSWSSKLGKKLESEELKVPHEKSGAYLKYNLAEDSEEEELIQGRNFNLEASQSEAILPSNDLEEQKPVAGDSGGSQHQNQRESN